MGFDEPIISESFWNPSIFVYIADNDQRFGLKRLI